MSAIRAVIADDERLLREQLKSRLAAAWPDLAVIGEARDGREAVELVAALRPELVFLDIRMPLLTGLEAAQEISRLPDAHCEVVFVTAYDQYAIAAFEQGAIDYLLKPADPERLARTVQRLQQRLQVPLERRLQDQLAQVAQWLSRQPAAAALAPAGRGLRWLQAAQGNTLKLIAVDDVLFFRSDEKYTRIQTAQAEWLIRTPLRELLPQLDAGQFWQVHRATIVNVRAIAQVERDPGGRLRIHVEGHPERLEVSRAFSHLFRQM